MTDGLTHVLVCPLPKPKYTQTFISTQFDALFDLLTGREHLELYARVKVSQFVTEVCLCVCLCLFVFLFVFICVF